MVGFFSGQANEVAKEAANRWTGMYYSGTDKLVKLLYTYYDVKCRNDCAWLSSRKDISESVCINQVFIS